MKILVLICCFMLYAAVGWTCTVTWQAPTTYTDGSTIPTNVVIRYRVYVQQQGVSTPQVIYDDIQTSMTQLCIPGTYWATAYTVTSLESAPSNKITLQQLSAPATLQWSNQ